MPQTYCDRDDIISVCGEASLLASIDDDADGQESTAESAIVTKAIERAAVEMNSAIRHQYVLSEVASNDWCKWANVTLALYFLRTRNNNPAEQSVIDAVIEIRQELKEIRWGRSQLPEQSPSFDHTASVSNFHPELQKPFSPIRVDVVESTGDSPEGKRKRNTSHTPGW